MSFLCLSGQELGSYPDRTSPTAPFLLIRSTLPPVSEGKGARDGVLTLSRPTTSQTRGVYSSLTFQVTGVSSLTRRLYSSLGQSNLS